MKSRKQTVYLGSEFRPLNTNATTRVGGSKFDSEHRFRAAHREEDKAEKKRQKKKRQKKNDPRSDFMRRVTFCLFRKRAACPSPTVQFCFRSRTVSDASGFEDVVPCAPFYRTRPRGEGQPSSFSCLLSSFCIAFLLCIYVCLSVI